jgi:translation elongation factor EF-G
MSARRRWPIANISAKKVDIDYTHKKQSGGSGQFGRVKVTVSPRRARFGLQFETRSRAATCRRNISRRREGLP